MKYLRNSLFALIVFIGVLTAALGLTVLIAYVGVAVWFHFDKKCEAPPPRPIQVVQPAPVEAQPDLVEPIKQPDGE